VTRYRSRRQFVRDLGLSAAALPFALNLPGLAFGAEPRRKQRLIVLFSPNGTVPKNFWPDEQGEQFTFKKILQPLEPFKDKTLVLHGADVKLRGDGELFPGNIQGGSHTPAGWASGHSIDQEIRRYLQKDAATRTRFGSLELGVMVPDKADTWTRLSYAGPNQPLPPIDDPYQLFDKLYGRVEDQATLKSVLDDLRQDMETLRNALSPADRRLLDEHEQRVREMEQELQSARQEVGHAVPQLEPGVREENDNMPKISKMQIDLLVNGFAADFARVATLQFTNSVGQARMKWLGIDDKHHTLSHASNNDEQAQDKLTRINTWYCEQMAYLAKRLAETPETDGSGQSMLDNTLIVWTNELGQGNSHTLNDIPFVLVGGAEGFKMGRSLKLPNVPHNRLLMSIAHAFGHRIDAFGNPDLCGAGPLDLA